jgi:hypothetical protein
MCGVVPHVWSGAPCVEWCTMCGVVHHVWSGAPCVEWCPMCGVVPHVWSGATCASLALCTDHECGVVVPPVHQLHSARTMSVEWWCHLCISCTLHAP